MPLPRTETVVSDFDKKNASLRLTLSGDVTSTTTAALHRDVLEILSHEQTRALEIRRVELDLNAARMVDSLGLNLIITILKWAKNRDARLGIQVARRGVYATLLAVGLDRQADVVLAEPSEAPTGMVNPD